MSHLDPKRPATTRELRQFGLLVGGAFTALAALTLWRNAPSFVALILSVLGVGLVLAGLAVPRRLARIHELWMAFALALSKVTTPIFMGVIYFGVLTPIGILRRLFGGSRPGRSAGSEWRSRPANDRRSVLARQF